MHIFLKKIIKFIQQYPSFIIRDVHKSISTVTNIKIKIPLIVLLKFFTKHISYINKSVSTMVFILGTIALVYLACNALLNYFFWYPHLYVKSFVEESMDYVYFMLPILHYHDWSMIFESYLAHVIPLNIISQYMDYRFFHGSNFLSLVRQCIFLIFSLIILFKTTKSLSLLFRISLVSFAAFLITYSQNWYALSSSNHEIYVDVFFFTYASTFFYIKALNVSKNQYYYYLFSGFFAVCSSFSFENGFFVLPALILISMIFKRWKVMLYYMLISFVVFVVLFKNLGGFHIFLTFIHHSHGDSNLKNSIPVSLLQYIITAFSGGFESFGRVAIWVNNVIGIFVGLLIIMVSMFYIVLPIIFMIFKPRKKIAIVFSILKTPQGIFGFVLFIVSVLSLMLVVLTRVGMYNVPTVFEQRYVYLTYQLYISLFIIFGIFILQLTSWKRIVGLGVFFITFLSYLQFYLLPLVSIGVNMDANYLRNAAKTYSTIDSMNVLTAKTLSITPDAATYAFRLYNNMFRLDNIGARAHWQQNIMSMNIHDFTDYVEVENKPKRKNYKHKNKEYYQEAIQHWKKINRRFGRIWTVLPPCNVQITVDRKKPFPLYQHKNDAFIKRLMKDMPRQQTQITRPAYIKDFKLIHVYGHMKYSPKPVQLFIVNAKGIILGLGFVRYVTPIYFQYADIWNIERMLSNDKWYFSAFVREPRHEQHQQTYTLWALMPDKMHICSMGQFVA